MATLESATAVILTPAIGGKGFQHVGEIVLEYSCTTALTITGLPADEGNGSYGFPTITLPTTGGVLTKYFFRPAANKTKLIWFQFECSSQFALNFAGSVAMTRSWGSSGEYQPIPIFSSAGGEG